MTGLLCVVQYVNILNIVPNSQYILIKWIKMSALAANKNNSDTERSRIHLFITFMSIHFLIFDAFLFEYPKFKSWANFPRE